MLAISITVLYVLMALEYITHQKIVSDLLIIVAVLVSVSAGSIFFGAHLAGKDSPEKKRILYFLQNMLRYFLAFIFFYYSFNGLYGTLFNSSLFTLYSPVYRISGPELASRFFGYSHLYVILVSLSQLLCSLLLLYRRTTLAACVFGLAMMSGITLISFTHHFELKLFHVIYTLMLLYFILLQFDRVKAFILQGKIILLNRLPVYLTQVRHNVFYMILVKFFFTIALLICCFKEWKMKDDHAATNPLVGIWQFTDPG
ncbi:MAG: hypothetical protein JWQ30_1951, partial [Sediminibacterium sp.]|nr:hypothetical protein [Sediminibacterium sp.]